MNDLHTKKILIKKIKIAKKERKVSESLAGSLHRHSSLINVPWSTFFVGHLKPRWPREALTIALSHCAEVIATLHEIASESLWEWIHSPQGDVGIVFLKVNSIEMTVTASQLFLLGTHAYTAVILWMYGHAPFGNTTWRDFLMDFQFFLVFWTWN